MVTNEVIIDGDFASEEVTRLRDEADIIVTNPPFSKWRAFLAWIMEGHKQFLILGTIGAAGYKEVFPLIRDNQIWLGVSSNKTLQFQLPDDAAKYKRMIGDKKYADVPACTWFTNIDNIVRHTDIPYLTMEQHTMLGHTFQKYDNYDAIDVPRCTLIPFDYTGLMGVPISFMAQYNPEQFEIVDITKTGAGDPAIKTKVYPKQTQVSSDGKRTTVTKMNDGANIVVDKPPAGTTYYMIGNVVYIQTFPRILIRRRFEWTQN